MFIKTLDAQQKQLFFQNLSLPTTLRNKRRDVEPTPMAWFYEPEKGSLPNPASILENWEKILREANKAHSHLGDVFTRFDLSRIEPRDSKFAPQGGVSGTDSEEVRDKILAQQFEPSEYDDEDKLSHYFPQTQEFATLLFGKATNRLRPKAPDSVTNVWQSKDALASSSGIPRASKRKEVAEEEIIDAMNGKAYMYPAIYHGRYYHGKNRGVWGFPMSVNIIEATFQQPMQDAILVTDTKWISDYVAPWRGFNNVKELMTPTSIPVWTQKFGGDTTAMDAHMRAAQLRLFYEIVKWGFQSSQWEKLYTSIMHTTKIPIIINESEMVEGSHGLASGSVWTNISETVLQMFIAWTNGITGGQGTGDDFWWPNPENKASEYYVGIMESFGLPANPEKQSNETDEVTFLQRLFHKDFHARESDTEVGAYYPTTRSIASILFPERRINARTLSKMGLKPIQQFALKCFMIMENCVDNPCFEEFVKFVCDGNKYLYEFAKLSAGELETITDKLKSTPDVVPSYNQEKRDTSLASFQSIAVARKMA